MGLPALQADYLFLGPLIKQRLVDMVPDVAVDICETAEQIYQADKRAVVLMVMYAGDRFNEAETGRSGGGTSQQVFQRWGVMIALSNASQAKDARQVQAGPLMSQVHRALAGWTPEGCVKPLQRANAPLRPDITPQKAIYPVGFEAPLNL